MSKAQQTKLEKSTLEIVDVDGELYFSVVSGARHFGLIGPRSAPSPSVAAYAERLGVKPDQVIGSSLLVKLSRLTEFGKQCRAYSARMKQEQVERGKRAAELIHQRRAERKATTSATKGEPAGAPLFERLDRIEAKLDELLSMWRPKQPLDVVPVEGTDVLDMLTSDMPKPGPEH